MSGKDGSTGGYGVHKGLTVCTKWIALPQLHTARSWVTNINKHTESYTKRTTDYNDVRKYADAAGIVDIGSKNDVKGIRSRLTDIYLPSRWNLT